MAKFSPLSKSTKVSSPQIAARNASRVTISPPCSIRTARTWACWDCSFTISPSRRSSPGRGIENERTECRSCTHLQESGLIIEPRQSASPMTLSAGARFGQNQIVGPLGAGGMGQVFRARDPRLGCDIAIEILPTCSPATRRASPASIARRLAVGVSQSRQHRGDLRTRTIRRRHRTRPRVRQGRERGTI